MFRFAELLWHYTGAEESERPPPALNISIIVQQMADCICKRYFMQICCANVQFAFSRKNALPKHGRAFPCEDVLKRPLFNRFKT